MFLKQPKIRDRAYLDLLHRLNCCHGGEGDVVGAHCGYNIPSHKKGGTAQKHCDSTCVPLSFTAHQEQHRIGEKAFWGDRNPYQLATNLWTYYSVVIKGEQKGEVTEDNIRVMNNIIRQWKSNE